MPESTKDQLEKILGATTILSPMSFSFAGIVMPVAAASLPTMDAQQNTLVKALQDTLYHHCFCTPFSGTISTEYPSVGADDDLSRELSRANSSQPRWEPGWQVTRVEPSGQIHAQRFGFVRMFWPGEYILQDGSGMGPRAGSVVTVFFAKESVAMQPGFYFAFGERSTEVSDYHDIIRFYWNVGSESIVTLVGQVTGLLNRFQVPFRMKCLTSRSQYKRVDPALLYVNKRYYHIVAELLADIYLEVGKKLDPETPLFTKGLAPGLALAEDPANGESFGTHRCRILAEAIWNAYQRGSHKLPDRMNAVVKHFQAYGLDLERSYLNARSSDHYEPIVAEACGFHA